MENIREGNTLSDKEILKNVAKAVNRNIMMLAEEIDEKEGTLYQITAGRNHISTRIKAKIIEVYPNVNPNYIELGEEPIILKSPSDNDNDFKEEVYMQLALMNKKLAHLSDKLSTLIIALSKK
ncbi:hypothetical protein [Seonamhaeicola sp.]|uniref:hypothetical protein n=1 Tax=Seonamhaeicola sp. TaxID=1912245 RepID=UPI0035620EEF